MPGSLRRTFPHRCTQTSDRTLEDLDRFFIENHDVFVYKYPDAVSSKRPRKYMEDELDALKKIASVSHRERVSE